MPITIATRTNAPAMVIRSNFDRAEAGGEGRGPEEGRGLVPEDAPGRVPDDGLVRAPDAGPVRVPEDGLGFGGCKYSL